MQKTFKVVRRKDANLDFENGAAEGSVLHRAIDETMSDEMGGGYFRLNGVSNQLVLPYDELAVCLEGTLKLTYEGITHELQPGDFAWMPKGADVTFAGDDAVAFYGVHPVDWRTRGGSAA